MHTCKDGLISNEHHQRISLQYEGKALCIGSQKELHDSTSRRRVDISGCSSMIIISYYELLLSYSISPIPSAYKYWITGRGVIDAGVIITSECLVLLRLAIS